MSNHDERMREIAKHLHPKLSDERWEGIEKTLPKHARKVIDSSWQTSLAILRGTLAGGAGHSMDKQLREYFHDYNNRLWEYGPSSMPMSFNVGEAFVSFDPKVSMFRLRAERDHLFSFSDFVDFATSGAANRDPYASAYELEPGVIYSYNSYDDPHDLSFSSGNAEFVVAGVSLVRHGDELSALLIGGRIAELEQKTTEITRTVEFRLKSEVEPAPDRRREAVPLQGHKDLWRTLVLARYDLKRRTEQVKYAFTDWGDSYMGATDDPAAFGSDEKLAEELQQQQREQLDEHGVLFEIAKTATLLPMYFATKLTLVRTENVETEYSRHLNDPATRATAKAVPPPERVLYRRVAALRIVQPDAHHIARRFTPPQYRVEVDGFWRLLEPATFGHAPNGDRVQGRTWVRGHVRWRDRPEKPIQVLVKSRLAVARAIIEAEQRSESIGRSTPEVAERMRAPCEVSREDAYRERRLLTARVRWRVLQRDSFRCQRCGADAATDHSVRLDVDHRVPVSQGGKTEDANLWTLCSRCNNGKGATIQ